MEVNEPIGRQHAEVWRYDDPGHPDHGTWSWQLLKQPWSDAIASSRWDNIIDAPEDADRMSFPTWRSAFDSAYKWVVAFRYLDQSFFIGD